MTTFRDTAASWAGARPEQRAGHVWVVDDEPAAAALACEMCDIAGLQPTAFRDPVSYLGALRGPTAPGAVVLDWRLEHELSAALFMATRQRYPTLPIIFWTGSEPGSLPRMVHHDPNVRVLAKSSGSAEFDAALSWAFAAGANRGRPGD
jgi:FixJ family two-component response regulator